jgi:chromatin remodeling complex protein RSC6
MAGKKIQATKAVDVSEIVADVVATDGATSTTSTVDVVVQPKNDLQVINEKLAAMMTLGKEITLTLKTFQKDYAKVLKSSQKGTKGNKTDAAKRTPSGFAKPTRLSDELCAFLNLPVGSELARTNVTRQLNLYIKEHKLQREDNKKFIQPNAPLKELLKISDEDTLSYFNLQRYMKHLFVSSSA